MSVGKDFSMSSAFAIYKSCQDISPFFFLYQVVLRLSFAEGWGSRYRIKHPFIALLNSARCARTSRKTHFDMFVLPEKKFLA